jgi:hypothetical protein
METSELPWSGLNTAEILFIYVLIPDDVSTAEASVIRSDEQQNDYELWVDWRDLL